MNKAYSTLSSAFALAVENDGTPEYWDIWNENSGDENLLNEFAKYLNVTKNCGKAEGCWPKEKYKYLSGENSDHEMDSSPNAKAQLADGSLILFDSSTTTLFYNDCKSVMGDTLALKNVCGYFYIDINGFKKPNAYGQDFFSFWITKYGIVPNGTAAETKNGTSFETDCALKKYGWSCTAWVLYNRNMDYLRCPGQLSWDGLKKCP